jgi:lipopolysaccharide transport system ATP-binding protein
VQHHWIDDAVIFRVTSSRIAHGLIGIPMVSLEMTVTETRVAAER